MGIVDFGLAGQRQPFLEYGEGIELGPVAIVEQAFGQRLQHENHPHDRAPQLKTGQAVRWSPYRTGNMGQATPSPLNGPNARSLYRAWGAKIGKREGHQVRLSQAGQEVPPRPESR